MNFLKNSNFALKSIEIPVGFYFQLVSITINFTNNRDYRPILNSLIPSATALRLCPLRRCPSEIVFFLKKMVVG